jgi:hypothetical protein
MERKPVSAASILVHALVLGFASAVAPTLAFAAVPGRAERITDAGPCDDLVAYIREVLAGPVPYIAHDRGLGYREQEADVEGRLGTWRTQPRAYAVRVAPACRAETRRGAAPAVTAAVRALTQQREPAWIDRGRVLLCTLQDPDSLSEVSAWVTGPDHAEVRAICTAELATWPGAAAVRDQVLGRAVRERAGSIEGRWEIDPAVVAAANVMGTPELYDALVPVLVTARAHQALGYDRLRDAVCDGEGPISDDRAPACATLPADSEDGWRESRRTSRLLMSGAVTAAFAGAVAAAIVERHDETGRWIATAAGVPMGAVIGMGVAGTVVSPSVARREKSGTSSTGNKALLVGSMIAGTVAGGLFGAWAAHSLAASPGSRGTVTGIALAPMYFGTELALFFD